MMYLHLAKHLKSCLLVLYFKMWLFVYKALLVPRNLVLHSCHHCRYSGKVQRRHSSRWVEWPHKMKEDGFSLLDFSCVIPLACYFLTSEAVWRRKED